MKWMRIESVANNIRGPRGLVMGGEIGDVSQFPSDNERILKLINDHGNVVNANSESGGDIGLKRRRHAAEFPVLIVGSRKSSIVGEEVLQDCCIAIEEDLDYIYRRCRTNDKSIGPLEIRVVKTGTFELLMDLFIKEGASINQYKIPRCIKSDAALKLLNSNVIACFFSPRDPTWIP